MTISDIKVELSRIDHILGCCEAQLAFRILSYKIQHNIPISPKGERGVISAGDIKILLKSPCPNKPA